MNKVSGFFEEKTLIFQGILAFRHIKCLDFLHTKEKQIIYNKNSIFGKFNFV